jgi:endonuclease/exonuclease/phosphatase family metal-dependent hydrolase
MAGSSRLKVLVYNVRGFRAGAGVVADAVRHFEPDVALITECGSRHRLRSFAKRLGMKASNESLFPLRRVPRNAVLVRPPLGVVSHRMHRFADAQRFFPRGALVAEIETDRENGGSFTAVAVHLGLLPAERRRHAAELVELVASPGGSVITGGDLNEVPTGQAPALVSKALWDVWLRVGESTGETFPSGGPEARIDYLFVSEDIRPVKALVPVGGAFHNASDHLPIVAEVGVELRPRPES